MKTYIKQNGTPILSLEPPIRKVALWHITKRCNMECKYCYGTFEGSSYKKHILEKDFELEKMLHLVDFLSKSGIDRIHLCGGEPFLYNELYELLKAIKSAGMEAFVLSNLTFLPENVETIFSQQLISNISFSLDSLNRDYNYYIRGAHEKVISNIEKVMKYKNEYDSDIELGLYIVATKKNLDYLIHLIDWAVQKGINYITLQAVYLPKTHKYYDELSLTQNDLEKVKYVFDYLVNYEDKIRVSGSLLRYITNALITKDNLSVENCFVESNSQYYFIDGYGNIKTCTTKKNIIGCVSDIEHLSYKNNNSEVSSCSEFCLDCIGIWEMVYPEEVNDIVTELK